MLTESVKFTQFFQTKTGALFFTDKNAKVPAIYLYKENDDLFKLIISRPRVFTKIYEKLRSDDIILLRKNNFKEYGQNPTEKLSNISKQLRLGHPYFDLNLDVLHQYPSIFTEKTIHGIKSLHQLLCVDYSLSEIVFKKMFGEHEVLNNSEDVEFFHDCRIYFPTGMQNSRKKNFERVLEDCKNIFRKHGLEKVVSGNIKFSKIPGNAVGLYFSQSKDIKIDPSSKDLHRLLYVLIHEFIHKLEYEFIPNRSSEINKIFIENKHRLNSSILSTNRVELNDEFEYTGKKKMYLGTWIVSKTRYSDEVKMTKAKIMSGRYEQETPVEKIQLQNTKTKATLNAPVDVFISHGFNPKSTNVVINNIGYSYQLSTIPTIKTDSFYPTDYSKTNSHEWFAETMTMYFLKALIPDSEIEKTIKSFL